MVRNKLLEIKKTWIYKLKILCKQVLQKSGNLLLNILTQFSLIF